MADNALYYPSINLPSTPWFTQVLLYWDEVATIFPVRALNRRGGISTFTHELIDSGLVTALDPLHFFGDPRVGGIVRPFLALVDSSIAPIGARPDRPQRTVRIHMDKPGILVADELMDRGLATWSTDGDGNLNGWLDVEEQTGNLFMAFLAAMMAQLREGHLMDPVTDSLRCLSLFSRVRPSDSAAVRRMGPLRVQVLDAILPMPPGPPNLVQIARFKRDHREQLIAFRGAVERTILTAAAIHEDDLRERQLELSIRELQSERDAIADRMARHGWRRIQFASLAAVVAAATLAFDALSTGGTMSLAGNSIGLFSAVAAAFASARTPMALVERPMAYAALVRRRKLGNVSLHIT